MPTREPQEIRRDIERTREELARSIADLQQSMAEATDWRTWVRRRPLALSATVFGAGVVAGLL